jgi:NADPH:quinone reductase-like Zn-dependent oxidoreductase
LGAAEVIVTAEDDWMTKLAAACKDHRCRLGFDAVAGPKAGSILTCMPLGSDLYVYGGLSNQAISSVRPTDLIFKSSNLRGFWLTAYLKTKSLFGLLGFIKTTQKYVATHLKTDIRAAYPLEKAPEAIADYCGNMSAGKVAICPNDD